MRKQFILAAAGLALASGAAGAAETAGKTEKTTVGVSLNATILTGIGLSVGTSLSPYFNVRGVGNTFTYKKEMENDDGNYDGKFKLFTAGVITDYQPFAGAFRLSVGLLKNGNKLTLDGIPNDSNEFEVGDCRYVSNPANPLKVHGESNWKSMAPYAGIGWGGNMSAEPGFYGTFDIGVIFSGAAKITLDASGSAQASPGQDPSCGGTTAFDVTSDPNFQAERKKAEDEANNEVKDFKLWPAIGFGLGWRF